MSFIKKITDTLRERERCVNFTCDLCGREVFANERVCTPCKSALPANDKEICPLCGRKVREAGVCIDCRERPLRVACARSAYRYTGEAARLIREFKRDRRYLAITLAELSYSAFAQEFAGVDALVFVPMTAKAESERGYNQARLFAEELARRSGIPLLCVSEKVRDTLPQKALGRREREKNLAGCFRVTDRAAVKGKRLVIVDDALTTGATVSELADVLLRAGALSVGAFTFASVEKTPSEKPKGE